MNYITALDNEILWTLKNNFAGPILDKLAVLIFNLSRFGIIWVIIVMLMLLKKNNRKAAVSVVTAMAVSFIFCYFTKGKLFYRMPPFMADPDIALLINAPMGSSFPSVPTVLGFSASVSISIQKKQWSALVTFLSSLMAMAQLYLMLCYPIDILISIIIGAALGYLGVFLTNRLFPINIF